MALILGAAASADGDSGRGRLQQAAQSQMPGAAWVDHQATAASRRRDKAEPGGMQQHGAGGMQATQLSTLMSTYNTPHRRLHRLVPPHVGRCLFNAVQDAARTAAARAAARRPWQLGRKKASPTISAPSHFFSCLQCCLGASATTRAGPRCSSRSGCSAEARWRSCRGVTRLQFRLTGNLHRGAV